MKKTLKVLTLLAISSLTLIGCGEKEPEGPLPKGGEEVNVKEEAGKQKLAECVDKTASSINSFSSIGVSSDTKANVAVSASTSIQGMGDINVNLGISNFEAITNAKAQKGSDNKITASVESRIAGGHLSLTGSLPGAINLTGEGAATTATPAPLNASMELATNSEIGVYVANDKIYANLEPANGLVSGANTFVSTLIGQVKASFIGTYLAGLEAPDLVALYNRALPDKKIYVEQESPKAPEAMSAKTIADLKENLPTFMDQYKMKLVTWKDGAYALEASVDKAYLVSLIPAAKEGDTEGAQERAKVVELINSIIQKFEASAYVYFNKDGALAKLGFDVELNAAASKEALTESGALDHLPESMAGYATLLQSLDLSLNFKASEEMTVSMNNVTVTLPSDLASYKKVEVKQPDLDPEVGE